MRLLRKRNMRKWNMKKEIELECSKLDDVENCKERRMLEIRKNVGEKEECWREERKLKALKQIKKLEPGNSTSSTEIAKELERKEKHKHKRNNTNEGDGERGRG